MKKRLFIFNKPHLAIATVVFFSSFFYSINYAHPDCISDPLVQIIPIENAPQDAKIYLEALEEKFSKLTSISGYPKESLLSELEKEPNLQWFETEMKQDRISFAMNRTERSRESIAEDGFKNQYQTRRSGALYNPKERSDAEASLMGISKARYKKLPLNARPKYAYLSPTVNSELLRDADARTFGPDVYIFKKNRLKDWATWTPGDSLNNSWAHLRADEGDKREWGLIAKRFIPWTENKRMLLHLWAEEIKTFDQTLSVQFPVFTTSLGHQVMSLQPTVGSYFEIQLWKPNLNLDDVESFIFYDNPPSGKFLKALRKRRIKIYKNINGKDQLWKSRGL